VDAHVESAPASISESSNAGAGWSPWAKRIASVLLAWHVAAVFIAPCAVEPTSRLFRDLWSFFHPYLEVMYVNHGYHFFAPEPGPGHLIEYQLEFADGRTETGRFPDRDRHRPRLLYHRHFMLSEFLNATADSGASSDAFNAYVKSFGDHLRHRTGAERVSLSLIRHRLATGEEVLAGVRLDAPQLYRSRPLGVVTAEGLEHPETPRLSAIPGAAAQSMTD
jgi:hypothetical protein